MMQDAFRQWKNSLSSLESTLGHIFHNRSVLETACVHSSYTNEFKETPLACNERLELLGDTVLNLIITEFLFTSLPEMPEGQLSKLRASIVSAKTCHQFAEKLELSRFLLVGRGELINRQKIKTSILADFFEALIGALYLDGGIEAAKKFIHAHFLKELEEEIKRPPSNWKAELQELLQKTKRGMPIYKVLMETGPDHNKYFEIGVFLQDTLLGKGSGSSKKEAEQNAALEGLTKIQQEAR